MQPAITFSTKTEVSVWPVLSTNLPEELKEFIGLCRAGQLFAIQRWIAEGKRFQMPEGRFSNWPLRGAIDAGFHSLVEVLLQAGVSEKEKLAGLRQAIKKR